MKQSVSLRETNLGNRYTYNKADSASLLIDLQHGPAWREEPVSYTHLDVYKRQGVARNIRVRKGELRFRVCHPESETRCDGAVSYTHLDVYKRQADLYTMPSQDPSDTLLEHLCVHEFRHVVQIDKVNQGLTKILYYLFGEQITIAITGLYPVSYTHL